MAINVLDPNNAEKLREAINNDPEFRLASRNVSLNLNLGIGLGYFDKQISVQIHGGQVVKLEHLVDYTYATDDLAIKATEEFWENFLKPIPSSNFASIYSGMTIGQVMVSGSQDLFLAYSWAIMRLMGVMRIAQNDLFQTTNPKSGHKTGYTEPQTGKYVYVEVDGIEYRVYYEENGRGIPLVCQHTAGSDGQQYRHVITDPDVTSKYRVIVIDLPYHGKSQPPAEIKWWAQDYQLREEWFIAFHKAFNKALGLQNAVYLGSSMGGNLALDLALKAPDLYRACIGLGGSLGHPNPRFSLARSRNPRVHDEGAALVNQTLTSPTIPEANKWEVAWAYLQGAPGICGGDSLFFYRHDVHETAHQIDTTRCAVYIMNGEYDWGTTFKDGEAVVAKNPGIKFFPMHGLGHFAMTEDYPALKRYLIPVLDEIAALYF